MKPGSQYRLITLMVAIVIAAVAFAVVLRPPTLERQLRRDLDIPPGATISIIDHPRPHLVIAVKRIDSQYTLFAAFSDQGVDGAPLWHIPVVVGSGAPLDVPEYDFEYSRDFDHLPSPQEIAAFRDEFGLN